LFFSLEWDLLRSWLEEVFSSPVLLEDFSSDLRSLSLSVCLRRSSDLLLQLSNLLALSLESRRSVGTFKAGLGVDCDFSEFDFSVVFSVGLLSDIFSITFSEVGFSTVASFSLDLTSVGDSLGLLESGCSVVETASTAAAGVWRGSSNELIRLLLPTLAGRCSLPLLRRSLVLVRSSTLSLLSLRELSWECDLWGLWLSFLEVVLLLLLVDSLRVGCTQFTVVVTGGSRGFSESCCFSATEGSTFGAGGCGTTTCVVAGSGGGRGGGVVLTGGGSFFVFTGADECDDEVVGADLVWGGVATTFTGGLCDTADVSGNTLFSFFVTAGVLIGVTGGGGGLFSSGGGGWGVGGIQGDPQADGGGVGRPGGCAGGQSAVSWAAGLHWTGLESGGWHRGDPGTRDTGEETGGWLGNGYCNPFAEGRGDVAGDGTALVFGVMTGFDCGVAGLALGGTTGMVGVPVENGDLGAILELTRIDLGDVTVDEGLEVGRGIVDSVLLTQHSVLVSVFRFWMEGATTERLLVLLLLLQADAAAALQDPAINSFGSYFSL
jgi:hypothetical protein